MPKTTPYVIKLEHNQFKAINRIHNVLLEVTVEINGHEHIQKILMYFVGGILIINGQTTVGMLLMFMGYISSFNGYADRKSVV